MQQCHGLRRLLDKRGVGVRVSKYVHTAATNKEREEMVKEALAVNWIHCPPDGRGPHGTSLLAEEMKHLQLVNGRVAKPTTGEVRTDDLWTAFSVTVHRLMRHVHGSRIREALARVPLAAGLPGGYQAGRYEPPAPRELSLARQRLATFQRSVSLTRRGYVDLYPLRRGQRLGRDRSPEG